VRVDVCTTCGGTWFDQGELRATKDERLKAYRWYDLDLWKHDADFMGSPSSMCCPACDGAHPLTTIRYAQSPLYIDVCANCHGIWLDASECTALLTYIREQAETVVLEDYRGALLREFDKALSGQDAERTNLLDILTLVDLFKYKFAVEHERLARILVNLPH
jgi:Zn-finger nucleic acid-binding protein